MRAFFFLLATSFAQSALPPMPEQPPQITRPETRVRAGHEVQILLDLKLPKDRRLHPGQKFVYRIAQTSGAVKVDALTRKGYLDKPRFPIKVPFVPPQGRSEVLLQVAFYYCPKDGLEDCKAFSRYYLFPLVGEASEKRRKLALSVEPD
ncbi:MAG: hypothetical protein HY077_15585 [Elusimicrobia bacterium]|nr:hypothetical protein [Elusimicrobiota bacterium]